VRPRAKVTIDSLWEIVHEKSIGNKMNDLDLCLELVSRSCQPLRYIQRWISRKPLEAWFQRTTNRKWHMGYQFIKWSHDRWRHVTPKVLWNSTVGYLATAWRLVW